MSTNLDPTESSPGALVATEPASTSDAAINNEVKVNVSVEDDLLESNAGTLTMGGNPAVHESVNDSRVSEDEKGVVAENVEKILDEKEKEKEKEVNDEEKEGEFKVSDLVWGKVRNYPWWPGQIFDPSSATEQARKYSNKKGLLVAYFGDQSFAWNEKSKIKPFRKNFFKMEKQSDSNKFLHAVDCALDEVLRRIEFGLSCSCVSKEVYDKIKSQTFVNAGIRKEDSSIHGGDNFSTVSTFKPAHIVQSVQDLAREQFDGFNRLQVLSLKSKLFAYYRWKGYHQFSTRYFLDGLDEKSEDHSEIPLSATPASADEKVSSKKRKFKEKKMVKDAKPASSEENASSKKRKFKDKKIVKDEKPASSDEKASSKKRKFKDKKMIKDAKSDSPDEKVSPKKRKLKDKKIVKDAKAASLSEKVSKKSKLHGSESVNSEKHKRVHDDGDMIPKKKEKLLLKESGKSQNGIGDKKPLIPTPKRLFGVGESICRIAKQLSVSPLIRKKEPESQFQVSKDSNSIYENCVDQTEESTKSEKSSKSITTDSSKKTSKEKLNSIYENHVDQTDESTKSEKSTKSVTSDSSLETSKKKLSSIDENPVDQTEESKKSTNPVTSDSSLETSKDKLNSIDENRVDQMEKSSKSDESSKSVTSDSSLKTSNEKSNSIKENCVDQTEESTKSEKSTKSVASDSSFKTSKEKVNAIDENSVDQTEESTKSEKSTKTVTADSSNKTSKENLAAALILKFTNLDSIPSVTELNEIFKGYGRLMESETEVLKKSNCAKIVFEEKSNAETAFSSAGKFGIFGASLISYKLDYSPTPRKIYTRKGKKKIAGDSDTV